MWFHSCDYSTLKGNMIRRVVVETVFLLLKYQVKKLGKVQNIPDIFLAKYDEFDDYLETIIQFGVSLCVYVRTCERPATFLKLSLSLPLTVHHTVCLCFSSGTSSSFHLHLC